MYDCGIFLLEYAENFLENSQYILNNLTEKVF